MRNRKVRRPGLSRWAATTAVVAMTALTVGVVYGPSGKVPAAADTTSDPTPAAVDYYLKLGDIKGESKDSAHKDEIDVLSWSWGLSNSATTQGGGGGSGKVSMQDLNFTKYVDKASPQLMLASAKGTHIREATLTVRKAGDRQLEYIVIKMEEVLVTSVQTGGGSTADLPTENVTLNFEKIHLRVVPQNDDGSPGDPESFGWDFGRNRPA